MIDVKSFATEATNHLGKILNTNANQVAGDIENRFRDPSVDKELYQYRGDVKLITYSEAINELTYVNIDDGFKTINDKMYPYFYRLFNLNIREREQTLYLLGNDSPIYGDSDSITPVMDTPKYAEGVTYSEFMRGTKLAEKNGQLSTMYDTTTFSKYYNNGQLYKKTGNLYPDENDTGLHGESDYEFNKWDVGSNPNSILYKTKQLFKQRKINTLISRFGTHADEGGGTLQYNGENGDPLYGESRGRNLLTKSAENGASTYKVNGYNNPYCRVWTHHYQHSKLSNTMRPFADEAGNPIKNSDFHKWDRFTIENNILSDGNKPWGWKNGDPNWDKSVLDKDTGILNITPKYMNGKESNIHTKDCMFSIENLAWKDFDPYSFERALSWEQRGPNGGRIMWFPPYGINFSEQVSTEWTENKFIGRGESVYSYANTKRSGVLEFLMVVDHPSILDYALWDPYNDTEVADTDILRFFAGCDEETVKNAAKPTPLTDEYLKFDGNDDLLSLVEKEQIENEEKTIKISTKIFFPNNYTGLWDINVFNSNPLGYLFNGVDASIDITNDCKKWTYFTYPLDNLIEGFWKPFCYSFKTGSKECGYETYLGDNCNDKCGISFNKDTNTQNKKYPFKKDNKLYIYDESGNYNCDIPVYYRVDGMPKRPVNDKTNKEIFKKTVTIGGITGNYEHDISFESEEPINLNSFPKTRTYRENTYDENMVENDCFSTLDKMYNDFASNTYGQSYKDDTDKVSYGLNMYTVKGEDTNDDMLTLPMFFYLLFILGGGDTEQKLFTYDEKEITISGLMEDYINRLGDKTEKYKTLLNNIIDLKDKIEEIKVYTYGNASQDGETTDKTQKKRTERNYYLAWARSHSSKIMVEKFLNNEVSTVYDIGCEFKSTIPTSDINTEVSHLDRSSRITVELSYKTKEEKMLSDGIDVTDKYNEFTAGLYPTYRFIDNNGSINQAGTEQSANNRPIFKVGDDGYNYPKGTEVVEYSTGKWTTVSAYKGMLKAKNDKSRYDTKVNVYTRALGKYDETAVNKIRYDQEYHFFKKLKREDPIVFERLVDKLKYFDPAFHSMTPEGINARLTFLHQCTRQGDTTTASDVNSTSANNLAFGRPPFCVLRLGDFYNQMIVIKSYNIDYSVSEGIVWDFNQEGIGAQPLLCKVTLNFDFIGGGDLAGPVRRLQNAMSFNYYANTGLYDNRADRPFYDWDPITGKAEFKPDKSYAHSVAKDYVDNLPTEIGASEYISGVSGVLIGNEKQTQEQVQSPPQLIAKTDINEMEFPSDKIINNIRTSLDKLPILK